MFDPRQQEQALAAAERLAERCEISLAALDRAARFFVAAEQVLDFASDGLALGLAEGVILLDEHLVRALRELEPFGGAALVAREVALQAQAVGDVLRIAELLEARACEFGEGHGFGDAPGVAQGLGLPAILEGQGAPGELAFEE